MKKEFVIFGILIGLIIGSVFYFVREKSDIGVLEIAAPQESANSGNPLLVALEEWNLRGNNIHSMSVKFHSFAAGMYVIELSCDGKSIDVSAPTIYLESGEERRLKFSFDSTNVPEGINDCEIRIGDEKQKIKLIK